MTLNSSRLRVKEAAAYCRLSPSTLNRARVYGGGPVYSKLGRIVVYALADLDAWIDARRRTSTSGA